MKKMKRLLGMKGSGSTLAILGAAAVGAYLLLGRGKSGSFDFGQGTPAAPMPIGTAPGPKVSPAAAMAPSGPAKAGMMAMAARRAYPSFAWDLRNPGVSANDNVLFNLMPYVTPGPGYQSFWNPQDPHTMKFSGSLNCECCNPRVTPLTVTSQWIRP
jgi:hypothetical protein